MLKIYLYLQPYVLVPILALRVFHISDDSKNMATVMTLVSFYVIVYFVSLLNPCLWTAIRSFWNLWYCVF